MRKFRGSPYLASGSAMLAAAMACAAPAYAQEQTFHLDIPAQGMAGALRSVASASHQQVIFDGASVAGLKAPALKGRYTAQAALSRLVSGSGLKVERGSSGIYIVKASLSADPNETRRPASLAASAPAPAPAPAPEPDIIVTGTRLKRTEFDSPIPVVALQKDDISETGYRDLGEALVDMPGVDQGISLSNGQTSTQTNGLSTVSLRGLGTNRTLTLIDGHRTVSNVGNANAVSMSTIPTFFVDRIDVSTGGASAVYGSDAIAGVINIITENGFEGVKARAVGSATNDGGGDGTEYSIAVGNHFLDDRLYVMATVTYEKQNRLAASDRDWATGSYSYDADTNELSSPSLSSYTPGGRFLSTRGAYYYTEEGLQSGFTTEDNGYETRTTGTLITPRESISAGLKLGYDFSNDLRLNASVLYSNISTHSVRAPYYISNTSTYGVNDEYTLGRISRDSPLVPDEIAAASSSSGVDFRRRLTELGNLEINNKRETWRSWVGLEGKAFGDWDWDLTYGFGRFEQNQTRANGVNYEHVANALDVVALDDGTLACASEAARADGCVPLNIFGLNSISEEAADYIRGSLWYQAINSQHTLSGNLSGTLFDMPAGPFQLATGFELRRDHTETHTDELTASGYSNLAYIPEYSGTVKVAEAYAEANMPLLRDTPFFYRLSVDGALRVARYNLAGVGTTMSYRLGAQWEPVRGLNLRTTFSRAQRAPDTTELYSPARDDYDDVIDICSGVTASTTGTVADNCRSNAGIAAAIAANGVFTQEETNINAPNAGNADLKEETAYTWTAGVVLAPAFLPGFQASVDYYDIRVKDAISALSNTNQQLECYSDPDGTDNRFCEAITRDEEGQLTRIINQQENLDELRARGIDVALAYRFAPAIIPGSLTLRLNYNRRLELGTTYQGIASQSSDNWLGEVGTSKNTAKGSIQWSSKRAMIGWTTVYIGKALDSNDAAAAFAAAGITDPLFLHVPAYWRHDLNFRLTPPLANPNLRIFGTVRNVFNKYGPFLPSGTESGNSYNYSSVYGVTGRVFTLGVQFEF
ncbi:TonB-dependent receptor [Novosphingobium sp. 1949]|uniref:TonB-dependent receptor n=1 Tax=Novosphingobium organovorum TaxID=2930092 RepID=A0ABT0BBX8_9SPHN|nr:TonB-dependent receptor [Novosphingobium organovorum]MCJ2182555.1 TonB-dependent receptor [Novosphingobium organovorum]